MLECDFLIIGSGGGGLFSALHLAPYGKTIILSKKDPNETATSYAQGGIAAVLSKDDSYKSHIEDTLKLGCGICREDVVRVIVESGPEIIRDLENLGVIFDRDEDGYHLSIEGGHSNRRVAHIRDQTGRVFQDVLYHNAVNTDAKIITNALAVDLIVDEEEGQRTCYGAVVLTPDGTIEDIRAKITILATGGAGKVYLVTSNPDISTGDGLAMAYRAGAKIINMEFVQFHPTCLYLPGARPAHERTFLITEAARGEGAILTTIDGDRFMPAYDHLAELAPRDVVSKAIYDVLSKTGDDYVLLDMRPIRGVSLKRRFPYIYENCLKWGYDITMEPIPVIPAAHYICGGVETNLNGRTSIERLYAVGEVAYTGMHGANRLASNSLLETFVMAKRASQDAIKLSKKVKNSNKTRVHIPTSKIPTQEKIVISHEWNSIRRVMTSYASMMRSDHRLNLADKYLALIGDILKVDYKKYAPSLDLVETFNLHHVACLIVKSALMRKESRGLHYNVDYPQQDDENFRKETVITSYEEE
ncbi:MAG: L-aspartate oxidase [Candidatus Coatesbacteria bacterium]|nr:MAG: L-aspartate oxidase [Candidatus Coatesbacteria bacterium]